MLSAIMLDAVMLNVVMLNAYMLNVTVMLGVIMPNVNMPNVIMLSVIMLSVMAPFERLPLFFVVLSKKRLGRNSIKRISYELLKSILLSQCALLRD
jgi:hypothetical protein